MNKNNSKFILGEKVIFRKNIHEVIGIHYTLDGIMYKVNNAGKWAKGDELQKIKSSERGVRKGKNTKR